MTCTISDIIIKDDNEKGKLKKIADKLIAKNYPFPLVQSVLNDPDFRKRISDAHEGKPFIEIHSNTIAAELRKELDIQTKDVRNSIAKRNGDNLNGFQSSKAKYEAINYTVRRINTEYYEERNKSKNARRSYKDILKKVRRDFEKEYEKFVIDPLVETLTGDNANEIKDNIHNIREGLIIKKQTYDKKLKERKTVNDEYNDLLEEYNKINDEYDALPEDASQETIDSYNVKLDELEDRKTELEENLNKLDKLLDALESEYNTYITDLYVEYKNVVDEYGNYKQKNWSAFISNLRSNTNEWYRLVFSSAKLRDIVKMFEDTLNSDELDEYDYIDEDDYHNNDADTIDEMAKHWEDVLKKSFEQGIDKTLMLYLDSIPVLNTPVKDGNYDYDTNNELGVETTMDSRTVLEQLKLWCDFSSPTAFIESLRKVSQDVQGLYGFGKIVDDILKNQELGNLIFSQCAAPIVNKCIATIESSGIRLYRSNRASDKYTMLVYNLFNSAKNIINEEYDSTDIRNINKSLNDINTKLSKLNKNQSSYKKGLNDIDNFIIDFMYRYFPNIDRSSIVSWLKHDNNDLNNRKELLENLRTFADAVTDVYESYLDAKTIFSRDWSEYYKAKRDYEEGFTESFNKTMPVMDYDSISYNKLYKPIIEIAKKLDRFTISKLELNSVNAEGHLASNIIGNNYISNLLNQIEFGTEEDANAGLKLLKEEVERCEQYRYNPLFFGVKDEKGKTVVKGLFTRLPNGEVIINDDAKQILSVDLFDGVRHDTEKTAVMYRDMSKGDYFITQLIAFKHPQKNKHNITTDNNTFRNSFCGMFMRTPSDAPKNFILSVPKYNISSIRGQKLFNTTNDREYINERISAIQERYKKAITHVDKDGNDTSFHLNQHPLFAAAISTQFEKSKAKKINSDFFIDLINGKINEIRIGGKKVNDIGDKHILALRYALGDNNNCIILVSGEVSNDVLYNVSLEGVYTKNGNGYSEGVPNELFSDLRETFIEEGIEQGKITRTINTGNCIFRGFKQQLLGELNTFVTQLHNVFTFDATSGEWILKDSVKGLFERAHYNGNLIDENGRLSGNFFKFKKLFKSMGYDVNEEMINGLSLYGQANSFIIKESGRYKLNINSDFAKQCLSIDEHNIKLSKLDSSFLNCLNDITSNWITNFVQEIYVRTKQYDALLNELNYKKSDVTEFLLNAAINEMSFDDVFEGGSEFYKNARDFLKRAKEVQAAGSAFASFDLHNRLSNPIEELNGYDGKPVVIDTYGYLQGEVRARNGWKAVTIANTVKPIENAAEIKDKLIEVNKDILGEEKAEKIATAIAKGFGDKTKTNDAQSYITIDEWIRRRYADGTLSKYKTILEQLAHCKELRLKRDSIDKATNKKEWDKANEEFRNAVCNMDVSGINARINVDKNFYFDKKFDQTLQTIYPRQIKNAEFVLIPELLDGTELAELYDIMSKHDIGQVNTAETSKAAKKNILTFWDNDTKIVRAEDGQTMFEKAIIEDGDIAIEDYYYRYLYKQQEVPNHMQDAKNKAGIQIIKKLLDNPSLDTLEYRDKFFANYTANIKEDFHKLIDNMGWKLNENGSIDTNGISFDEFYKKARHEAQRLGLDSNFLDYITPVAEGLDPFMPNYINLVSSKLESIAQSLFNSTVTRQKLPGWHAAQVTGIGHGKKVRTDDGKYKELRYHPSIYKNAQGKTIEEEDYNKLPVEEQSLYHLEQEAYAEVVVPRWSSLIPKGKTDKENEAIFKQIQEEGLDIQIGYRIPTEGKQSVSILKVVGILDDIYGSTVMVPDAWVTQTGSDFDVDSIYAINYVMKKTANGKLKKVKFDDDLSEAGIKRRYIKYVSDKIDERYNSDVSINELNKRKKEIAQKIYDEKKNQRLHERSTVLEPLIDRLYDLTAFGVNEFKNETAGIFKEYKDKPLTKYEKLIECCNSFIETYKNDEKYKEQVSTYKEYKNVCETILDYLYSYQNGYADFISDVKKEQKEKTDELNELKQKLFDDSYNWHVSKAKEHGLMTIEQFSKLNIYEQNTKDARSNAMLDNMIKIMEADSSREENFSRSNFDDLTDAKNEIESIVKGSTEVQESTYNPLDQIEYMNNAMSGARLKAFSVTRDTFNSICNYSKARLSVKRRITIEYDLSKYSIDDITAAFDDVMIDHYRNVAIVTHNRIANSKNNRNVVGKLLTPYSSQTTAHILDAIKEGSLINENEYTFGTFKTLLDIGSDYKTAISFLAQPAITDIVNAYNETKSIYINGGTNPINIAIKNLAIKRKLTIKGEPITKYSKITDVISALQSDSLLSDAFKKMYGKKIPDYENLNDIAFPLNTNLLVERLEWENLEEADQDDKDAFDLATIFTFANIHETTKNIEKLARCANADKFGAQQTVRTTRQKVDDIIKYADLEYTNPIGHTILVDGEPILAKLYPNISEENLDNIDVKESCYPYIASFLKYATIPSITVNSILFPTESDFFDYLIKRIEKKLGCRLNDDQYRDYKNYMMSYLYTNVPILNTPYTIDRNGYFVEDTGRDYENDTYWDAERARIMGYEKTVANSFNIPDKILINGEYDEALPYLKDYNKLTPAQKVIFIQTHFTGGKGIFNYLTVREPNEYTLKEKGNAPQIIRFIDQVDNMEDLYQAFRDSFFNKNPFVRLASFDLIKYAFITEGFRFKSGGISKIITNDALLSDITSFGTGIIDEINECFYRVVDFSDQINSTFIDRFIRSHSEYCRTLKIPAIQKGVASRDNFAMLWKKYKKSDGLVAIPYTELTKNFIDAITDEEPVDRFDSDVIGSYIKITKKLNYKQSTTTLYKIVKGGNTDGNSGYLYLIPLNLLDQNEAAAYSVNRNNNKFKDFGFYKGIIQAAEEHHQIVDYYLDSTDESMKKYKKLYTINIHTANRKRNSAIDKEFLQSVADTYTPNEQFFNQYSINQRKEAEGAYRFKDKIIEKLSTPLEGDNSGRNYRYIWTENKFIRDNFGSNKIGIIQEILDDNGDKHIVQIKRSSIVKREFKEALSKGQVDRLKSVKEKELYNDIKKVNTRITNPTVYRVEELSDEQLKELEEKAKEEFEARQQAQMESIVSDIEDIDFDLNEEFNDLDKVAKELYNDIDARNRETIFDENLEDYEEIVKETHRLGGIFDVQKTRDEFYLYDENNRNLAHSINSVEDLIELLKQKYNKDTKSINIRVHFGKFRPVQRIMDYLMAGEAPVLEKYIHIDSEIRDLYNNPYKILDKYDIPIEIKQAIIKTKNNNIIEAFAEILAQQTTIQLRNLIKEANERNKYKDDLAAKFMMKLALKHFNQYSIEDLHKNRRSIFSMSAEYYSNKAKLLLNRMHNFTTITGEVFSIDDPNLYKHLRDYPEDYNILVQLILEAKTFGGAFYDIMNLDVTGEDEYIKADIAKLKKSINDVRNTKFIHNAVKLLFNDYLANEFSNNPLIKRGLSEIREIFGNVDWFDLNFSDIGELNHKQIQLVTKYVYGILNEATRILAPKAVNAFDEQLKSILNDHSTGSFSWDHIIDDYGTRTLPYNEKFLSDRDALIEECNNALNEDGEYSDRYIKAKLARDEWRAKNTEQLVVQDYYLEDVKLRKHIYEAAPEEYKRYLQLIDIIYNDKGNTGNDGSVTNKEVEQAHKELDSLLDPHLELYDLEPDAANRRRALQNFVKLKSKLNHEYFRYGTTAEFDEILKGHKKFIERYDKAHPYESLSEKMSNEKYAESFNWLKFNTRCVLDSKSHEVIRKAFDLLSGGNETRDEKRQTIKKIIKERNAYDVYGDIDGRLLTNEDIKKIRDLESDKYQKYYDNGNGEASLIRLDYVEPDVLNDKFYKLFKIDDENKEEINKGRINTIQEINDLLRKCVDFNGNITAQSIFETLSEKELTRLSDLYFALSDYTGRKKEDGTKFTDVAKYKYDDPKTLRAWAECLQFRSTLKGRKLKLWDAIFADHDIQGNVVKDKKGNIRPSRNMFGYWVPKDEKYIAKYKTAARKIVRDNVLFETNRYYDEAAAKATAEGNYNEWFKLNHVYNQYEHKWVPLSIWTKMRVVPGNGIEAKYKYLPMDDNVERFAKDQCINNNYKPYSNNYKPTIDEHGVDVNPYANSKYKSLTTKERKVLSLLEQTMTHFATTYGSKKFFDEGYVPRRYKDNPDLEYYGRQALGALGLEFRHTGEAKWSTYMDYQHRFTAPLPMTELLKIKGYKNLPERPTQGSMESNEHYNKVIEDWTKQCEEIKAKNKELEKKVLDRDWENVFKDFIARSTEHQAKERVKNTIFLTLEDLKDNKSYNTNTFSGNLKKNSKNSTLTTTDYVTSPQTNAVQIFQNWARRILYNQFKKPNKLSKIADLMQNVTSAKYMIFNITGGIANITTGFAGISSEAFAKDYFGNKELREGTTMYLSHAFNMIADMYKPKTNSIEVAFTKFFDVVDFDAFTERRPNESATEYVKRTRDLLYSMQSGGEHFMQNTVLFAMLKSHRVFKDSEGKIQIGSFNDYGWKVERDAMFAVLSKKGNNYLQLYKSFLRNVTNDKNELKKYDTFTKDFNEEFLRDLDDKELIKEYVDLRKKMFNDLKADFEKNPTLESQFELVNGELQVKSDSEITGRMIGEFTQKVIQVNKKIHGVYDKIGAAKIEAEWWGGLVMQYHKHLYPGIMKRFRTKGYFNELRGTVEQGSYVNLAQFLATEFVHNHKVLKDRVRQGEEVAMLESIQSYAKCVIDTVTNLQTNWQLMPEWKRNNIKRCLGDLYYIGAAILAAMCIYAGTDDDDLKESEFLATSLYMTDRMLSEAQLYTPWGLVSEAKTAWSSPVAAQGTPRDLLKGLRFGIDWMFNEDFDPNYKTGIYAKQNKFAVLLYRNTPVYRIYNRLSNMTKNNSYYRLNETALNMRFAKNIADNISPEE